MGLGFLRKLFVHTARRLADTQPEARTYEGPPQPVGEWGLIVDRYGDEVVGRSPGTNDFLARHPIRYHYKGTIPVPDKKEYSRMQDRYGALMAYAARDHLNKALLQKAVLLLSQTEDGRRLLAKAHEQNFHFVFDDDRTKSEGAVGICDYENKQIPLAEGRSAEEVALTVKHELQHMEDIMKGVSYGPSHTLASSILADRALEANARVSEAVACAEMLNGQPQGPERQFRTSALFANFFKKNNEMAQLAHASLSDAAQGTWHNFARHVFDGYYRQTGTLAYYDNRQAKMYEDEFIASPDDVFDHTRKEYHALRQHFGIKEGMVAYVTGKLGRIASQEH